MINRCKKLLIGCLFGLLIGAGCMFLFLSGCEAKKENTTLKAQATDNKERAGITSEVVADNEKKRREIHKTMGAIHAQTENYIADDDNLILPAGAVRMYDDFVLRRIPGTADVPDAGATGAAAHP